MLPDQETTLEAAVLEELVRIASVKLAIALENESRILNDKRAVGLPHKNHSVKSIFWKKRIARVGQNPCKWYRAAAVYQLDLTDLKKISLEVFP
jgi:hypothetical protein